MKTDKIHGMANFDSVLEQQLNQRDADEAAYASARNAQNYSEMQSELKRLQTLIADLPSTAGTSEEIAESARLIASYADAMQ